MSFSDYTETALLNYMFGKTSNFDTQPTIYIALCESAPSDSDDGSTITEASYTGYDRILTSTSDWNSASGNSPTSLSNASDIDFPQSTGGSSTVTHFALVDASSGGNLLVHSSLDTNRTVEDGDIPRFEAGELSVTLD